MLKNPGAPRKEHRYDPRLHQSHVRCIISCSMENPNIFPYSVTPFRQCLPQCGGPAKARLVGFEISPSTTG
jgi:hypothetical protein